MIKAAKCCDCNKIFEVVAPKYIIDDTAFSRSAFGGLAWPSCPHCCATNRYDWAVSRAGGKPWSHIDAAAPYYMIHITGLDFSAYTKVKFSSYSAAAFDAKQFVNHFEKVEVHALKEEKSVAVLKKVTIS